MKRDLVNLARNTYDVLVIGGGIYGISVARDAALRGLQVALIDKGDFGHATSSNHHKIIHGGLRYLQHGDLKRMRESIRERSILLRNAPHLVRPLPFLIPFYKDSLPGKLLMSVALKINDLISLDRNRYLDTHKRIPNGRVISASECRQLCPYLDQQELTGGAIYFDGQIYNSDRLNLALLLSAVKAGAKVANYAQAIGFLQDKRKVTGVEVRDVFSGYCLPLRARVVVNCTGPWVSQILRSASLSEHGQFRLSKALVLITRPIVRDIAVGVPSHFQHFDSDHIFSKDFRYLFLTPWRDTTLIGTFETSFQGEPDHFRALEQDIDSCIAQINAAFPGVAIQRRDVYGVLGGLLPGRSNSPQGEEVSLKKHPEIHDHAVADDLQGLISVLGVKYTTARSVAEQAINLVFKKLAKTPAKCTTGDVPAYGGAINCFEDFLSHVSKVNRYRVSTESLEHLAQAYGSEYQQVLRYCDNDPVWSEPVTSHSPIIKAEIIHGVRAEMAQKLSDIVFRRTELGSAGYPGDNGLLVCAKIMASELGWSKTKLGQEIQEIQDSQSAFVRIPA